MLKKFNLKLDHVGSITSGLDDVSYFYEKVLGFRTEPPISFEKYKQKMQYFSKDGYTLEFIHPERDLTAGDKGFKHLAFTCTELDGAFAEIQTLGFKVLMPEPLRFEDRKFFFFEGPNNALIEFMEYDAPVVAVPENNEKNENA